MAIKRKIPAKHSKVNSILLFKKVFLNNIPEIPVTRTIRKIENILKISTQMLIFLSSVWLFSILKYKNFLFVFYFLILGFAKTPAFGLISYCIS